MGPNRPESHDAYPCIGVASQLDPITTESFRTKSRGPSAIPEVGPFAADWPALPAPKSGYLHLLRGVLASLVRGVPSHSMVSKRAQMCESGSYPRYCQSWLHRVWKPLALRIHDRIAPEVLRTSSRPSRAVSIVRSLIASRR